MLVTQDLISGDVSISLNCEDCGAGVSFSLKFLELCNISTPDGVVELKKRRPELYYCTNCLKIQKEAAGN